MLISPPTHVTASSISIALGVMVLAAGPAGAQCPVQQADKLLAGDGGPSDVFGRALAAEGDTLVVTATGDDDRGFDAGAAYVLVRDVSGSWWQQAKLTASDGGPGDSLGRTAAISGNSLIMGSIGDDDQGTDAGAAYVFIHDGATWSQQAKLIPSAASSFEEFGWDADIDGDTAIVGSGHGGAATIFVREAGTWTEQATLLASDSGAGDVYGATVAVSGDTAAVGAFNDDDLGENSGSVFIFERATGPGGASWTQVAKLHAVDGAIGDTYGRALAMEGDTLVVGAPFQHGLNYGAVYVVARNASGDWTQQSKLVATARQVQHWLGSDVEIGGDRIIAGGAGAGTGNPESAVIWVRRTDSNGQTVWMQQAEVVSLDHAEVDLFGKSVAVTGRTAFVGAFWDDDRGFNSGSLYLFDLAAEATEDCNGNGIPDCEDIDTAISLDCNGNGVPDECDLAIGAATDCNGNGFLDECEALADGYVLDDGGLESSVGLTNGGEIVWLNHFTVAPRMGTLATVQVEWGESFPAGMPATVLVYDDPNNDGVPHDMILLVQEDTVSQSTASSVPIPPTSVGGPGDGYFVGVRAAHAAGQHPAALDGTSSQQRSWLIAHSVPGNMDLENLGETAPLVGLIDSFGIPGNWGVRATATETGDCNANGMPDDCDIAGGISGDLDNNEVPDECDCPGDTTGDGTVDVDDLINVILDFGSDGAAHGGDLTDDGIVNVDDLTEVILGWGTCPG
jgi:hypothetical protein